MRVGIPGLGETAEGVPRAPALDAPPREYGSFAGGCGALGDVEKKRHERSLRRPGHADRAEEAARRSVDARLPRPPSRPLLAEDPRVRERDGGAVPRSQLAGEEHDHEAGEAPRGAPRPRAGRASSRTPRPASRARRCPSACSPYLPQPHRLVEALRGSAPHPVPPASRRGCCRITRSSTSTRSTSRPTRPVPGPHAPLSRQGALPPARHLPRLLPLLHAQLRGRRRHRRGREGQPQGRSSERWAARLRVHRLASGARGHRHLGRRRLPAPRRSRSRQIGERAPRDAEHPPHARRDQGARGHAAEAPHRSRVGRRAHPRRREGPQAPQGGGAPHALQPPERDHRHHAGRDAQAARARHRRAQPDASSSAA